jgi:transcriptional regulator with XRE-family HTH domain
MRHAQPVEPAPERESRNVVTQQQRDAFALALRRLREDAGLSQRALSRALGLTNSAVWQWEQGRAIPRPEVVAALEKELGLAAGTLSRLLGYLPAGAVEREMISVIEAVQADSKLGERERELLTTMYRQLIKQRRSDG